MGLMIGIKVKCDPAFVQKEAIKKGLLVLTAGKDVVRLLPPLVITKKELKIGIDIILEILSDIEK
jgi:acetylornithine/N-succinyldiaminopimelate aminotransferase